MESALVENYKAYSLTLKAETAPGAFILAEARASCRVCRSSSGVYYEEG